MEEKSSIDKRLCSVCGTDKTYIDKQGQSHWYNHTHVLCCEKCELSVFKNPRRIKFKGKPIPLKKNPRTGTCSKCGKITFTHMHHDEYHEDDPLKDTRELCRDCHIAEHSGYNAKQRDDTNNGQCPRCLKNNIIKCGHVARSGRLKQRFYCKSCLKFFT